jgi:hypothetical protein
VAERLRHATTEGRLSTDELEERLGVLYRTRTYGELESLVADLPVTRAPARMHTGVPYWAVPAGAAALALTVLGMLAGGDQHRDFPLTDPGVHRQFGFSGPLADPHHGAMMAASAIGVVSFLIVCATLAWLLLRSRRVSDA